MWCGFVGSKLDFTNFDLMGPVMSTSTLTLRFPPVLSGLNMLLLLRFHLCVKYIFEMEAIPKVHQKTLFWKLNPFWSCI